jgi:hypothetical protein
MKEERFTGIHKELVELRGHLRNLRDMLSTPITKVDKELVLKLREVLREIAGIESRLRAKSEPKA